jgi:2'-hydroxyisoflavone reductase
MRILVLGGTAFVGRAIVESALRNDFEVTLFGRGRTGTDLFPGVERRTGDRDTGDYTSLSTGTWDAVVDVSGYVPRHVGQAMAVLGDRIGRYLFVSSHAVYLRDGVGPGSDEDTPRRPPRRDTEELDEETYGPCKVACEDDVLARYGDRATIIRPGKVAGRHDPQDGLTYWVRRAARGGRVAVPGTPAQPVQVVDARDLGAFAVRLLCDDRSGAYNAIGPETTLGQVIETCAHVAGSSVTPVPVPIDRVGSLFPLVRPEPLWHTQQRSAARAYAAGFTATPLAQTVADVLAWDPERGEPPLGRGLTPDAEAALLDAHATSDPTVH